MRGKSRRKGYDVFCCADPTEIADPEKREKKKILPGLLTS